MKRLLVTGATGLIGRQVLPLLSDSGYELHALVNKRTIPPESDPAAIWHDCDLLRDGAARAVIRQVKPTHLMHLAWSVAPGSNQSDIHSRWLQTSQDLVRSFYEAGGTRTVIAGTCFEYAFHDGVCNEASTPTKPNTLYGECKDELRRQIENLCSRESHSWAWGRIFFVYGPGEHPARLVPAIILNLLNGRPARCSHGHQIRDYLHSRDVASAFVHLLNSAYVGPCNIGSGKPVSLREIGQAITARTGNAHLLEWGALPAPAQEPPRIEADITRLRDTVRWQPHITLADGLAETVDAWRSAGPTIFNQ